MSYKCPKCQSENIRKVSEIYSEGVQTGTMSNQKYGSSTVITISAAAKQLAPPKETSAFKILFLDKGFNGVFVVFLLPLLLAISGFCSLGLLGGQWVIGLIGAIGFLGFLKTFISKIGKVSREARDYNQNVFPGMAARWERMWKCNRCGEFFTDDVFEEAA